MKSIQLALIVLVLAGPAAAADRFTFRSSADDLATLAGIADTHRRIKEVARDYCRDSLHGTRGIARMVGCIRSVTDDIVDGVNDRGLTAYAGTGRVDQDLLARR